MVAMLIMIQIGLLMRLRSRSIPDDPCRVSRSEARRTKFGNG